MNATAPYSIPDNEGRAPSLLLAAVVHAVLIGFLWFGVKWQSETPIAMEAEVWDMEVQEAAPQVQPPPVVEPEPVPEPPKPIEEPEPVVEDPEIKLEQLREEKRKQDLAKLEEKRKEDERRKKEKAAEEKRIAELRAQTMKRNMAVAGTGSPNSTATAARTAGPRGDPSYAAQVVRKIKSNITYGGDTDQPGNPTAEYRITQLPTGEILSVRRVRSSGIPAYDAAIEKAIAKSSPLPRKKDGTVDREITAIFTLKELP